MPDPLPPAAAAIPAEPVERKAWTAGIAPSYIGAFLWVAFLDSIGARAVPVGGLLPAVLGVAAAASLAVLILYRPLAEWGFATGRSLDQVAGSTFGTVGVRLVPNGVIALAQVGLFAVGIGLATEWVLAGLQVFGLIDAAALRPVPWRGATVPPPVASRKIARWRTACGSSGALPSTRRRPHFPAGSRVVTAWPSGSGVMPAVVAATRPAS